MNGTTPARAFKDAADAVSKNKGAALLAEDTDPDAGPEKRQRFYSAHLAVVGQVIHAEETSEQSSLIRALSSIPRPEATAALAVPERA